MRLYLDFDRTIFDTWEWHRRLEKDPLLGNCADETDPSSLVFDDARRFLARYAGVHVLTLLTFGDKSRQRKKVAGAGINAYLDGAIYTGDNPKAPYLADAQKTYTSETVIFVDDDGGHMAEAHAQASSVILFRMCRPQGEWTHEKNPPYTTLSSFDELSAMLSV